MLEKLTKSATPFLIMAAGCLALPACGSSNDEDDANADGAAGYSNGDAEGSGANGSGNATGTSGGGGADASGASGGGSASGGQGSAVGGSVPGSSQSCIGADDACTDDGTSVSCCSADPIQPGSFLMGRSNNGTDACPAGVTCPDNDQPEHEASVSRYQLDTFEVTVSRFRQFVAGYDGTPPAAGAGAHPLIESSGWNSEWDSQLPASRGALRTALLCSETDATWTDEPGANETLPINCVTWFEAFAFCAWDGGRLPTEAEWEYAAAGGDDNRLYPWGSQAPDSSLALYQPDGGSAATLVAVGSAPAGQARWGAHDLAGSLWEWVLDLYWHPNWYEENGSPCNDCANVLTGDPGFRVIRGGAFSFEAGALRATSREVVPIDYRRRYIGFRCAR
jgi:sulfatase modifying factor 1